MAQTVRRCPPPPAAARRARGLAVAVAGLVLALVAPLAPGARADNRDPVFPSQAEVDASKGAVAKKADQVGQIEAQLAAASVRADQLATDVARGRGVQRRPVPAAGGDPGVAGVACRGRDCVGCVPVPLAVCVGRRRRRSPGARGRGCG